MAGRRAAMMVVAVLMAAGCEAATDDTGKGTAVLAEATSETRPIATTTTAQPTTTVAPTTTVKPTTTTTARPTTTAKPTTTTSPNLQIAKSAAAWAPWTLELSNLLGAAGQAAQRGDVVGLLNGCMAGLEFLAKPRPARWDDAIMQAALDDAGFWAEQVFSSCASLDIDAMETAAAGFNEAMDRASARATEMAPR